jgi:hypothetical protein
VWLAWEAAQLMARPGSNTFLASSFPHASAACACLHAAPAPAPLYPTRPGGRGSSAAVVAGRRQRPLVHARVVKAITLRYALLGDVLLGD